MEIWVTVEIRTVDGTYGRRDRRNQPKSRTSVNDSESLIWTFLGQYLSSGVKWGLYERIRTTPRPTRCKLGDITASRALFRVIFIPRDPCDNSESSVRARSFVTTHLTETVFWHRMTHRTLANALIQCLRWKTSPRTSESDKYWPLWTEKCSRHVDVISDLVILDFKIFFSD